MEEIGKFLKNEREKQKLTIDDVAERTKIHMHKLKAIEEGRRELLPAKVFCIGLIKSYARELRVDMNKIDELCQHAFSGAGEELKIERVKKAAPSDDDSVTNQTQPVGRFQVPKILGVAASIALSGVLIFVIYLVVEKMNSYSEEELLPREVISDNSNMGEEESDEGLPEPPPQKEEKVAEQAKEPKPSLIAKEPEQPPKVEEPRPAKEVEAKTPVPSQPEPQAIAQQQTSNATNEDVVVQDNKLSLTAMEPVRAEVVWSDGYVQVMLLKSNETKTLVFSSPITLRVNNGGAIKVSFNEGEKQIPGTFNQPIELKFP